MLSGMSAASVDPWCWRGSAAGEGEAEAAGEEQPAAATEDEDANQSNSNVVDNVDKSSQPTSPSAMTPIAHDTAAADGQYSVLQCFDAVGWAAGRASCL